MAGDVWGDWGTCEGSAAHMTHLGTVVNPAISENSAISQVYDSEIRKFRQREHDVIDFLMGEDRRAKHETVRGFGDTQSFSKNNKHPRGDMEDIRKETNGRAHDAIATKEVAKENATTGGITVWGRSGTTGTPPTGRKWPTTRKNRTNLRTRRPPKMPSRKMVIS